MLGDRIRIQKNDRLEGYECNKYDITMNKWEVLDLIQNTNLSDIG